MEGDGTLRHIMHYYPNGDYDGYDCCGELVVESRATKDGGYISRTRDSKGYKKIAFITYNDRQEVQEWTLKKESEIENAKDSEKPKKVELRKQSEGYYEWKTFK